jgi:hypothetical protein
MKARNRESHGQQKGWTLVGSTLCRTRVQPRFDRSQTDFQESRTDFAGLTSSSSEGFPILLLNRVVTHFITPSSPVEFEYVFHFLAFRDDVMCDCVNDWRCVDVVSADDCKWMIWCLVEWWWWGGLMMAISWWFDVFSHHPHPPSLALLFGTKGFHLGLVKEGKSSYAFWTIKILHLHNFEVSNMEVVVSPLHIHLPWPYGVEASLATYPLFCEFFTWRQLTKICEWIAKSRFLS